MCGRLAAGSHVTLPDGRVGTVVYNGLDGIGIKWGRHDVTLRDVAGGLFEEPPTGYPWFPDAMLRDDYPGAELPCVGTEYEVT